MKHLGLFEKDNQQQPAPMVIVAGGADDRL